MSTRSTIAYMYDGSFEGFMCCVFESVYEKEMPVAIMPNHAIQGLLYETKWIETDAYKAERVLKSIPKRISREALYLVSRGFLTCLAEKELYLLKFLRIGYKHGAKITNMLAHPVVGTVIKAVKYLEQEAHKYTGFVRFTDYGTVLVSEIEPKNQVLPLIAAHFTDRYNSEAFMIYDKTHKNVLLYANGRSEIVPMEEITLPKIQQEELYYRQLWRKFYKTIGIKGRYNPKCRMNFMPKRYWPELPEMEQREEQMLVTP